jgi:hypothetical protein
VADVIDNDSWRIWPGGRKEDMLDKQVYRDTTEVTDEALRGVLAKYKQVAALTDAFAVPTWHISAEDREHKPKEACGVFGIWGEETDVHSHDADWTHGPAAPRAGERGRRCAG